MDSFYENMQRVAELYSLLQDEKSRRLFWDRIKCDVCPNLDNVADLYADAFDLEENQRQAQKRLHQVVEQLYTDGKELLLYGAGGSGNSVAELLEAAGVPFSGFCDRRAGVLKEVHGKPVYPPEYLFAHKDKYCVLVTAAVYFHEILNVLRENQFPEGQILPYLGNGFAEKGAPQYFEFPKLYRPGTAFVDGGCYNAESSVEFSNWCGGKYSLIFAFEPDGRNAELCLQEAKLHNLRDFRLYQAGMGQKSGTGVFVTNSDGTSHFQNADMEGEFFFSRSSQQSGQAMELLALDEVVNEVEVGFIKMDIEGSELDALMGAATTLHRDKPLLAISAYHRKGDLLALMDYLHSVVPEYRFWVRHYSAMNLETVLYAAIPQ